MNEPYVTLQGWVGNDVDLRDAGEHSCASFRLACTPRYRKDGVWVDGTTSWFTVNCWRSLAGNVRGSVRRGDAVVVHGRVRVEVWQREGQPPVTSWIVEASFVGHDLSRGTSVFTKATTRSRTVDPADAVDAVAVADGTIVADRSTGEVVGDVTGGPAGGAVGGVVSMTDEQVEPAA